MHNGCCSAARPAGEHVPPPGEQPGRSTGGRRQRRRAGPSSQGLARRQLGATRLAFPPPSASPGVRGTARLEVGHLFEGRRDYTRLVRQQRLGQRPERRCLRRAGGVLQHRAALHLAGLNRGAARDEAHHAAAQAGSELGHHGPLEGLVTGAVADHPRQTCVAAPRQPVDALGDVVGRVQAHKGARTEQVDLLREALADRLRKAAAHHIAQDVVEHHVERVGLEGFEVFEHL